VTEPGERARGEKTPRRRSGRGDRGPDAEPGSLPRLGGRACLAIYLAALVVRAAVVFATGSSSTRFADAPAYLLGARALAETGTYPRRTDSWLFRPPGYSFFLAAATLGHPDSIAACRLVTAAAGSLAPVLLAALSARLFRRRGLALGTGVLAAVHPALVLASSEIQSEAVFLPLLLAAAYLLLAASDRPSSNLAVLAGAFLALAALTRSSALAVAPFLLAPLFDPRHPRRANLHIALSALLGFGVALAPWTVRNALVFRELILVNDGAGYVFYGRNAEAALGLIGAHDREALGRAVEALERARLERIAGLPEEVRASPGRLSRALTEAALDERRADPAGTLRLLAWKIGDWLRPWPDPRFWPMPAVIGVGAYAIVLWGLFAVGCARAQRSGARLFCLLFLAATMLLHVVLETNARYRAAYWDPVLVLYAAFGAATLAAGPAPRPAPAAA